MISFIAAEPATSREFGYVHYYIGLFHLHNASYRLLL